MNKQRMIAWIATCDTGVSSMTMWSALMGVKRKKDLDIPKDNRDFRRCFIMKGVFGIMFNYLKDRKNE